MACFTGYMEHDGRRFPAAGSPRASVQVALIPWVRGRSRAAAFKPARIALCFRQSEADAIGRTIFSRIGSRPPLERGRKRISSWMSGASCRNLMICEMRARVTPPEMHMELQGRAPYRWCPGGRRFFPSEPSVLMPADRNVIATISFSPS